MEGLSSFKYLFFRTIFYVSVSFECTIKGWMDRLRPFTYIFVGGRGSIFLYHFYTVYCMVLILYGSSEQVTHALRRVFIAAFYHFPL